MLDKILLLSHLKGGLNSGLLDNFVQWTLVVFYYRKKKISYVMLLPFLYDVKKVTSGRKEKISKQEKR